VNVAKVLRTLGETTVMSGFLGGAPPANAVSTRRQGHELDFVQTANTRSVTIIENHRNTPRVGRESQPVSASDYAH